MSIVLRNGITLPDLPKNLITEETPYACIAFSGYYINDEFFQNTDKYKLVAFPYQLCYFPPNTSGLDNDMGLIYPIKDITESQYKCYTYTVGNAEKWVLEEDTIMTEGSSILWSNYDILILESIDEDYNFTFSDEVYFKGTSLLPNGVEVPKLPDGCFDGTPYGVITKFYSDETNEVYSLFTFEHGTVGVPYDMLPEDFRGALVEADECVCMPLGAYKQWNCQTKGSDEEPTWLLVEDMINDMVFPIGAPNDLPWANHDCLRVTSLSADATSYTIGTEIARKSDVNYRITEGWVRSIANETRRLSHISDGLTTDEMGETLRSIELSSGSVIDLPNAMEVSF